MALGLLAQYWGHILAVSVTFIILFWAWDEREDEEEWAETTQKVSGRAKHATGGFFGVLSALLFGLSGVLYQTGMGLGDIGMGLADFITREPETASSIGVTLLGWLGLSGYAPVSGLQFVGVAILLIGIGLLIAARRQGKPADADGEPAR